MLKLNLPEFDHKISKKGDALYIFDIVRKKYIFLTPEEWVRQHFLQYLINQKHIPASHIRLEHSHVYNQTDKRSDILVFGNSVPVLLVECKAPHIAIDDEVTHQLGYYNASLQLPYLAITNGIKHYYFRKEADKYIVISELPLWGEMV